MFDKYNNEILICNDGRRHKFQIYGSCSYDLDGKYWRKTVENVRERLNFKLVNNEKKIVIANLIFKLE